MGPRGALRIQIFTCSSSCIVPTSGKPSTTRAIIVICAIFIVVRGTECAQYLRLMRSDLFISYTSFSLGRVSNLKHVSIVVIQIQRMLFQHASTKSPQVRATLLLLIWPTRHQITQSSVVVLLFFFIASNETGIIVIRKINYIYHYPTHCPQEIAVVL